MFGASVKILRHRSGILGKIAKSLVGPREVEVGIFDGFSVQKAIWNHEGTSRGIPPRPFFDVAMDTNKGKYRMAMIKSAIDILRGKTNTQGFLTKLGILAQGDVQQAIVDFSSPPNAPSTIAKKGFDNPLIDTGEMKGDVTYRVK